MTSAESGAGGAEIDATETVLVWNSTPDETNLPLLMALEAMGEEGYKISTQQLEGSNLPFQALAGDQAQFTAGSLPEGALSVQAGAPIRIISTRNANQVVWVAGNQFQNCADLGGQPVGIFSETGGYTVLMKLYFDKACPGVEPRYVTIPDSPLRAEAVANGELAGTTLGTADAVALADAHPNGEFFQLPLSDEIPGVGDEYVYANQQVLAEHPAIAQALVQHQLEAIRLLYTEPGQIKDIVARLLPDAAGPEVAEAMAKSKLWYANGGLAGPGMADTLAAFKLPGTPEDLVDMAPMDAALAEIGQSDQTEY